MACGGIVVPPALGARRRLLELAFALGVAAFFWAFVAGLVYLLSIDGALPLRSDPLVGARRLAARGDAAGALRQYRMATLLDPSDRRALTELGELLARAGRYEEALEAFEKALRAWPDPRALAGAADVLVAQGQLAQAVELYERSLALLPKQAAVLNGLGKARALQGELDRAIVAFEASLALAPGTPARANLQLARAEKARREQAKR